MPSASQLARPGALGIIGYPLDRTASPLIHNTALGLLGIPWSYTPLRVAPKDLRAAIKGVETVDMIGFNVTYPHKETIGKYLTKITPEAAAIGAVNTVVRIRTGWAGDNTDVHGFKAALREYRRKLRNQPAIILGAGGAARTAAFSLVRDFHVSALMIVTRRPARARDFVRWATQLDPAVAVDSASLAKTDSWRPAWNAARIVVNATPVGMMKASDRLIPSGIRIHPDQIIYDLIYGRSTHLLNRAARAGATAINGDTMFWQQAARSFEIWTGKRFPLKRVQAQVRL